MMKTFFKGLLFGAGFAISFVVIQSAWFYWVIPAGLDRLDSGALVMDEDGNWVPADESEVEGFRTAPATRSFPRTGSIPSGSHDGRFDAAAAEELEEGPGRLEGRVLARGEPVTGLRLRLALNGDKWSSWTRTNDDGVYRVSLPLGEYRVDGYRFDNRQFMDALIGTIRSPAMEFSDEFESVGLDVAGVGPDLVFVDPVRKLPMPDLLTADEPMVLAWEPYAGAAGYRVVFWESESDDPDSYMMGMQDCGEGVRVEQPFVDLGQVDLPFRADRHYAYTVYALDAEDSAISRSETEHPRKTFRILLNHSNDKQGENDE